MHFTIFASYQQFREEKKEKRKKDEFSSKSIGKRGNNGRQFTEKNTPISLTQIDKMQIENPTIFSAFFEVVFGLFRGCFFGAFWGIFRLKSTFNF